MLEALLLPLAARSATCAVQALILLYLSSHVHTVQQEHFPLKLERHRLQCVLLAMLEHTRKFMGYLLPVGACFVLQGSTGQARALLRNQRA